MSNLETAPTEVACTASQLEALEVLRRRELPLGGPRGIEGSGAHFPNDNGR
jgi:quercetin 2,3-dioxygenase